MAIWVPGWMQGGTYTAQQDRLNSRAQDWDEGVMDRLSLKVTQRAAGANLSVDVSAGDCIVQGDDQANQGNYNVRSDAVVNVTGFVATGSNTRYDVVGVQINDPNAGGAAGSNATIVRVAGTAAATPVIPAIPNSFLMLAVIGPFTTSTTSITTAMIHDFYTGTGPTGVNGAHMVAGFRDFPGTLKLLGQTADRPPNGWLFCNGAAVSRTTYARLYEHVGFIFGPGDGTTTFNLPDLQSKTPIPTGTGFTPVGATGGEVSHVLTAAETAVKGHTHTVSDPGHAHSISTAGSGLTVAVPSYLAGATGASTGGYTTFTSTTGLTVVALADGASGAAHNNMPPYQVVSGYIIRT